MLFDEGIDTPEDLVRDALTVELMPERVRYNLRIKASDLAMVKKTSGWKLPSKIGQTSKTGERVIFKLGPDEWILSDVPSTAGKHARIVAKLSKDFVMSAVDISHRSVGFVINGPMAKQAVNIGCPLDLSLETFPIGNVTRTIFENAPIQLYRSSEAEFHIECWRSFAPYLQDFLLAFTRDL